MLGFWQVSQGYAYKFTGYKLNNVLCKIFGSVKTKGVIPGGNKAGCPKPAVNH
jgi:hypothetical protein